MLRRRLTAIALAAVTASTGAAQDSSGTGFFINNAGNILTNEHVVRGCDRLRVTGYGPATVVAKDDSVDLAVVAIGSRPATAPLRLRAGPPRLAEDVYAIGFPLADVLSNSVKVTTGSVNSTSGIQDNPSTFQLSAPIQPGNSGGPVVDQAGVVMGIANATLSERVYDRAQNVNFAIKSRAALAFLGRNGISHSAVETAGKPASIEAVANSVVRIDCFEPAATLSRPSAPTTSPDMAILQATDMVGFDYQTLRGISLPGCRSACKASARCRAFTFNTRHDICFLKDDAMISIRNEDAVGGVDRSLLDDVLVSGFRVQSDVDSVGGDFARLRDSDFIGCFIECAANTRCNAFAYVSDRRECWLKDRVGVISPQPGVEFGFR